MVLAGLNHKLGYRGTTNTLLNFGENRFPVRGAPGAIGYVVGKPDEGLRCMFHMMNEARTGVGLGATMLGYAGYEASLAYARDRPQGRPVGPAGKDPAQAQIRIIEHADVKRMLLAQNAYVEGALALGLYCARLVDEQRTGAELAATEAGQLLEVLTPIVKSWPIEQNRIMRLLIERVQLHEDGMDIIWRDDSWQRFCRELERHVFVTEQRAPVDAEAIE